MTSQSSSSSSSLDAIVQHIIALSEQPSALIQALRAHSVKDTTLSAVLTSGEDPLSVLDIKRNTLGVLFILSARLNASLASAPPFSYIQEFCISFHSGQAQYAPDRVTLLARGIVSLAEAAGSLKHAIVPLFHLLMRSAPSNSHLTTVHPIFLMVCMQSGHLSAALSVLDHPVSQLGHDLTYTDNLLFHYTGGMILAALKRWKEAEDWFEICVSAPAHQPAALQMEALKKLICVQLISKGKMSPLPKYAHIQLMRMIKSTPYQAFVNAYPHKIEQLRLLLEKEQLLFTHDKTYGLLWQALDRAPRWQIKKLTRTYLTLSLAEIGKAVKITNEDEVREIILSMIDSSEISAQISASDIVTFSDITPQFTPAEVENILRQGEEQVGLLKHLEMELGMSREYLIKAVKARDDTSWASVTDEQLFSASTSHGNWADDAAFT